MKASTHTNTVYHVIFSLARALAVVMFPLACVVWSLPVNAKDFGTITSDHESTKHSGNIDSVYHISCVSIVDSPKVYTSTDINKPLIVPNGDLGAYKFQKGTDLLVSSILEIDGTQFLEGNILYYAAGGKVMTWEKNQDKYASEQNKDRLYVLPNEWDCHLYKGNRETSSTCKGLITAYANLVKEKHKTTCKE